MSKVRIVIVATLLASTTLASADAKYKRTQDVKIQVNLSDRVKPIQPKQPAANSEFKPELNADQVLAIQGLVGNIQAEQEGILIQLIQQTPDSAIDEKSDYYFRLGELYAKQQRYWRLKSEEALIAVDNTRDPGKKQQIAAFAQKAAANAKTYLLKAVKTYQALTSNDAFRNYPKMDMALFYYGYTLAGGHYMKEARDVYDKLLKNYPNSKYVPEAHLAFADYYFENNDLDNAEARYKQVLKFPHSSAYWYAMYKMGWIDLNKQRFQDALETFYQVSQATKNDKKQEVLNRASKKDFVRAYAEIGKADQAYNAFHRVDPSYAFDMEQILADLYSDQGKSDKAIYTYRDLMKRAKTNKNVCLWQYNVAHEMLSMVGATNADKVAEIENLNRLWGALKNTSVLPAAEKQECHDNAAAMSGELARAYHSESAKTKNPETLAYAERLYKVYLETFPDAEDFAETQYFYAELLWSRAENEKNARLASDMWVEAATAFTDVVKLGKVSPKLMKESAYAAVLGWKNALNVDPRPKQEAADEDPKSYDKKPVPLPIPEKQQKMLEAFDVYIKYIKDPKDDDLVGMKFLKANIYRRYNHFDEAIPIFEDILFNHPDHETAEYSANLLLDTYNRLQRYDDMLALVDKLDHMPKFLDGKDDLKQRLNDIKMTAMRKGAEAKEAKAKETKDNQMYVDCGLAYQDIYNRNPEDPKNDEVLYDAGVCFREGHSIGAAILMFTTLQKYYPKSKLTQKALAQLGDAFGDVAFYDKAAEKLEEYATKYAGEKDAYDAMSNAVFYRKGIGDDEKPGCTAKKPCDAISDTEYFINTFGRKKAKEAADADFSLTSIYEKRVEQAKNEPDRIGAQDQVIKHLREYIHTWGSKGGADKLVVAHGKIAKILWHESCPVKEVDGSCVKITRERAVAGKEIKRKKGKTAYVAPLQCGESSKIKLTVVPRDSRKMAQALGEVKAAAAVFEKMKPDPTDAGWNVARHWYAQGRFFQADVEYEKFLSIKFPANLDFGDGAPEHKAKAAKAQKQFDAWLNGKKKAAEATKAKYEKVFDVKDNAISIAAKARLGQVMQNFSDELFTAEIPKNVRQSQVIDGYDVAQDKVDAYCDALTTAADPLEKASVDNFSICLQKSTDLGWFSDWSKLCEYELGQIKPEEFPTASELRGDPTEVAPIVAPEPPVKVE